MLHTVPDMVSPPNVWICLTRYGLGRSGVGVKVGVGVGVGEAVGLAPGDGKGLGEAVEGFEPGTGFPLPFGAPLPWLTCTGVAVPPDRDGTGNEHAKAWIIDRQNTNPIRYFLCIGFPPFSPDGDLTLTYLIKISRNNTNK